MPPEWFATCRVAERMGTQPWIIDPDERIMPWEWADRVRTIMNCEAEKANYQRQDAASQQRINNVKSGNGKFQRR